jgi:curli production assembly/transport component CsgG
MSARRLILVAKLFAAAAALPALAGCAEIIAREQLNEGLLPPVVGPITEVNKSLRDLPAPKGKVAIAVYSYTDQTGQFKPSETTQTLSKAVTQGATSVIIKALQDTGNGGWFTVVERERLDNLLKERRIIQDMRKIYLGEEQLNPQALPPLLFAAILLEGGIIGYDSNLQTGGIGARLLGIGADMKYRLDTITIYLRAVSTKTGQVLASVVTHKTIASVGLQGGVFKFIAVDKVLEAEAGFTKNEPEQLAVQQAIEKAVYALVMEGSDQGIWSFKDQVQQASLVSGYRMQQFASEEEAQAHSAALKANNASQTAIAPAASPAQQNANAAAGGAVAGKAGPANAVAALSSPSSRQSGIGEFAGFAGKRFRGSGYGEIKYGATHRGAGKLVRGDHRRRAARHGKKLEHRTEKWEPIFG